MILLVLVFTLNFIFTWVIPIACVCARACACVASATATNARSKVPNQPLHNGVVGLGLCLVSVLSIYFDCVTYCYAALSIFK